MNFATRTEEDINKTSNVLVIEPFHGGSHQQMLETIISNFPDGFFRLVKSSPRHRDLSCTNTSLFYLSKKIPLQHHYELFLHFYSTMMPMAGPSGARSDFAMMHRIIYVNEARDIRNQNVHERFMIFAYYEILSCLAAGQVVFDSYRNMKKFYGKLKRYVKSDKAFWPPGIKQMIKQKSKVVHCPLNIRTMSQTPESVKKHERRELMILWPHRWDVDRNPITFFKTIQRLENEGFKFKICVLDETFQSKPSTFHNIVNTYNITKIRDYGYVNTNEKYYGMMKDADVVLTTAMHEYFGVTVLEAVFCGCIPVVPKEWAHKELQAKQIKHMYEEDGDIYGILSDLCRQKMAGTLDHDYRQLAQAHNLEGWFQNVMRCISSLPTE